uniref:arsenate reductase n=1 Tax=Altererythrobacter segetis TaxID=1104773 RepID=UPI0014092A6A|nr:arsenate reductase [Altererythrobacter segetis]
MIDFYGIPGCDTVKKARAWLDAKGVGYTFHDYKKEGADPTKLRAWVAAKGWETVLNRRGTTFRQLAESDKTDLDAEKAVALMQAHPSAIKRPVVEYSEGLLVGFDADAWQESLGQAR